MANAIRFVGAKLAFGAVAGLVMSGIGCGAGTAGAGSPPSAIRMYVFDCGTLEGADPSRFRLKADEIATARMSVACFLVVHPKGALMWDVGAVPDGAWSPQAEASSGDVATTHTL